MSKPHDIFTENSTILFFKKEKPETCRNSNLKDSRRPPSGDNINVTFTS